MKGCGVFFFLSLPQQWTKQVIKVDPTHIKDDDFDRELPQLDLTLTFVIVLIVLCWIQLADGTFSCLNVDFWSKIEEILIYSFFFLFVLFFLFIYIWIHTILKGCMFVDPHCAAVYPP